MFIDFFEIAFIVIPILAPVADKMGVDLIWFGVILAMNLQTSFLTPPFGFALFYLRSVAAKEDYNDRITGQRIKAVTTGQIYKGSIAFIVLQLIMVAAIVLEPALVTGGITKGPQINAEDALKQMREAGRDAMEQRAGDAAAGAASAPDAYDPLKGLMDAIKEEKKK
jgi:predicted histidine transporter YuiF (NhaC family)